MSKTEIRLKIVIRGAVQGVGFRPCVFRLAKERNLSGYVVNTAHGVIIEIEGQEGGARKFIDVLHEKKPQRAVIQSMETAALELKGYKDFEIRESEGGDPTTLILPDIAMCDDCRAEILDKGDRRYQYPFTNCTQCGPRYSIITALPYDRSNTSMKSFAMCAACQKEYDDPENRRFHAQPNACPDCGPHLELWDADGNVSADHEEAIEKTVKAIQEGKVVAVKGLGGFHLMVDATNVEAVARLRRHKHREAKPLAVMVSSVDEVKRVCNISKEEQRLLSSPEAPIVLLKQKEGNTIADNVAPGNPYLGAMLAYTPLHVLLLEELQVPVVATSANLSEEPICIDEKEALKRLKDIADVFCVHNRPIVRHVDDSVARVVVNREMVLRRARGYAPLPVMVDNKNNDQILAVGGHLKNSIALLKDNNVFLSQHIGDLETQKSFEAFEQTIDDLKAMYDIHPQTIVCDEHPGYMSTQYAQKQNEEKMQIQHHYAHIFSCMADNDIQAPVLGVSWDGTGQGEDDSIWGGEFLFIGEDEQKRSARFRPFRLPGASAAIKEPRRAALGFIYDMLGKEGLNKNDFSFLKSFSDEEFKNLIVMMDKDLQTPKTSSVGRLFDVVAALLELRQVLQFEGQAAMEVEFAAQQVKVQDYYSFHIDEGKGLLEIDLPLAAEVMDDLKKGVSKQVICAKFHNTLVECIVAVAKKIGLEKIVLSGGCFQNIYLLEKSIERIQAEGMKPFWHQRVATNDGGIALGQIEGALRQKKMFKSVI